LAGKWKYVGLGRGEFKKVNIENISVFPKSGENLF